MYVERIKIVIVKKLYVELSVDIAVLKVTLSPKMRVKVCLSVFIMLKINLMYNDIKNLFFCWRFIMLLLYNSYWTYFCLIFHNNLTSFRKKNTNIVLKVFLYQPSFWPITYTFFQKFYCLFVKNRTVGAISKSDFRFKLPY